MCTFLLPEDQGNTFIKGGFRGYATSVCHTKHGEENGGLKLGIWCYLLIE